MVAKRIALFCLALGIAGQVTQDATAHFLKTAFSRRLGHRNARHVLLHQSSYVSAGGAEVASSDKSATPMSFGSLPPEPPGHPALLQHSTAGLSPAALELLNGDSPSEEESKKIMLELVSSSLTEQQLPDTDPVKNALMKLYPPGATIELRSLEPGPPPQTFIAGRVTNRGGFGVVMKVKSKATGQEYAMKFLYKPLASTMEMLIAGKQLEENFAEEMQSVKIFAGLGVSADELVSEYHVAVPSLVGQIETTRRGNMMSSGSVAFSTKVVLMPLLVGSLEKLPQLSTLQQRALLRQVVTAVAGIHRLKLSHGDVKGSNMMVAHDGSVTLIDFGTVCPFQTTQEISTLVSTPLFVCPELAHAILTNTPYTADQRTDSWAVGILVFTAVCGNDKMPYNLQRLTEKPGNFEALYRAITGVKNSQWSVADCPAEADSVTLEVVRLLLNTDSDRTSVGDLAETYLFFRSSPPSPTDSSAVSGQGMSPSSVSSGTLSTTKSSLPQEPAEPSPPPSGAKSSTSQQDAASSSQEPHTPQDAAEASTSHQSPGPAPPPSSGEQPLHSTVSSSPVVTFHFDVSSKSGEIKTEADTPDDGPAHQSPGLSKTPDGEQPGSRIPVPKSTHASPRRAGLSPASEAAKTSQSPAKEAFPAAPVHAVVAKGAAAVRLSRIPRRKPLVQLHTPGGMFGLSPHPAVRRTHAQLPRPLAPARHGQAVVAPYLRRRTPSAARPPWRP
ncbi:hypothetical protein BESB_004510 [Besnoitia besnoiti]|uniref:Protein kinase domain-containing protein n=1 Tax=Besnoitia besnoiti TaxID=94643 RepID=A0A2A9MQ69_BESBE|nr:hypothetical protein BESB_004510 [Besnoitia besnoiti]PFH38110.1 hypothetical protein BESB_004510 [Besnoitia besnoiti]